MKKSAILWCCVCTCLWSMGQEPFVFNTPAYQGEKDLAGSSEEKKQQFFDAWDSYVERYTITAAQYNLSGGLNFTVPGQYYVNPKQNPEIMAGAQVPVRWESFPGRTLYYLQERFIQKFGDEGMERMFEFVDIGPVEWMEKYPNDTLLAYIPKDPCNPNPDSLKLYDPYGPRGWLDEYGEMAIMRNDQDKIVKIHFTCENPEYYWALWSVDPNIVLDIYRTTLGNNNIQLEDLYLLDDNGDPVLVSQTNRPAYNPINKWNNGTVMTDTYGGAMHLTSPPNELSAEIVLAGGAAVLREGGDTLDVANTLICCSEYGRRFRHSDPHIGQNVYQVVSQDLAVSLLNPVGLYLQEPTYQYFTLPDHAPEGADIRDCFSFVRGEVNPTGYPNNMILHMVMEVPESWGGITISDLQVLGDSIKYGSQVMQTIQVQLAAAGMPVDSTANTFGCVTPNKIPAPLYFTDYNVLMASFNAGLVDSANVTSNVLQLQPGTTTADLALVVSNITAQDTASLEISFPHSELVVKEAKYVGPATGSSLGSGVADAFLYLLTIEVPENTPARFYDLLVYNKNEYEGEVIGGIAVPWMIQIIQN